MASDDKESGPVPARGRPLGPILAILWPLFLVGTGVLNLTTARHFEDLRWALQGVPLLAAVGLLPVLAVVIVSWRSARVLSLIALVLNAVLGLTGAWALLE